MTESLDERIQRLEDIAALTQLTSTYAHFVNFGWHGVTVDRDGLIGVFTEDITWNAEAFSMHASGRDAVVGMLTDPTGSPDFAMHSFTNPVLTVTGETATGQWLLWVAQTIDKASNQVFQSEDLVYERIGGEWRIKSIDLHFGAILTGAH